MEDPVILTIGVVGVLFLAAAIGWGGSGSGVPGAVTRLRWRRRLWIGVLLAAVLLAYGAAGGHG